MFINTRPHIFKWIFQFNHINSSLMIQARSYTDYIPRRALMYVPGNDERKLSKISKLNADTIVIDFEDGVSHNRKREARVGGLGVLNSISTCNSELCVRVNSVSSNFLVDDLKAITTSDNLPSTLLLPKTDSPEDLNQFAKILTELLDERTKNHLFRLIIYIESALGLINMKPTLDIAMKFTEQKKFKLDAAVFGSDDFCADVGATRSVDGFEILYARQKFLTVCKAYGIQAIDMVHIDYKDLESLRETSIKSAAMGYSGRQVIHPEQINVVQDAYTPTSQQTQWAHDLITAFQQHERAGTGAFSFNGKMIDRPLLLQARNIIALSKKKRSLSSG